MGRVREPEGRRPKYAENCAAQAPPSLCVTEPLCLTPRTATACPRGYRLVVPVPSWCLLWFQCCWTPRLASYDGPEPRTPWRVDSAIYPGNEKKQERMGEARGQGNEQVFFDPPGAMMPPLLPLLVGSK